MSKQKKNVITEPYAELMAAGKMPGINSNDINNLIKLNTGDLASIGVDDKDTNTMDNTTNNDSNVIDVVNNPSTPVVAPAPTVTVDTSEIDKIKKQLTDAEHKYNVLQGMYNNETAELKKTVNALNELVNTIKAKPAEPTIPATPNTPTELIKFNAPTDTATPKNIDIKTVFKNEIEEYGEDMISVISKVASVYSNTSPVSQPNIDISPLVNEITSIRNELATLKNTLSLTAQDVSASKEQKFADALTGLCPTWAQLNADPDFLAYLAGEYYNSGFSRNEILQTNYAKLDSTKVASIFNDYIRDMLHVTPDKVSTEPVATQTVAPAPQPNKVEASIPAVDYVANMITPSNRSSAPVASNTQPAKIYKVSELDNMANKVRTKEIPYETFLKFQTEFLRAMNEGRIEY